MQSLQVTESYRDKVGLMVTASLPFAMRINLRWDIIADVTGQVEVD